MNTYEETLPGVFSAGLCFGWLALPFLRDAVGEEEFQECLAGHVPFVG